MASPQWLIECPDFFSSDVNKWADKASPCLDVRFGANRPVSYDSSGELTGDGQIVTAQTTVMMKSGSWCPNLQNYMFGGTNIKTIKLVRLSSIEGTNTPIQTIEYETCKISFYEQKNDTIEFSFTFQKHTDTIIVYGQDGQKLGQTSIMYDGSEVIIKSGS